MSGMLFDTGAQKSALISQCRRYRYNLTRTWDPSNRPICWIMLNPSTADAETDDRTISKICRFSRSWGAGGIVVVNLFALRSTDPDRLYETADRVGPLNDIEIMRAISGASRIIAAWGCDGALGNRDRDVLAMLRGRMVECLVRTKGGHPGHPLYIQETTQPFPLEAA